MTGYTQTDRPLQLLTPLGSDALLLLEFAGREAVSEPFDFTLKCAAPRGTDVAFEKVLGQPASVRIAPNGQPPRDFHGVIARLSRTGSDRAFTYYTARFVPKWWLLSLSTNCRVFQQISVPDILREVLDPLRPDLKFQVTEPHPARDFCVQYNEPDLAFASRLMEEEGIAYWFDHNDKSTTMVVTDTPSGFGKMTDPGQIIFDDQDRPREPLRVSTWAVEQELRPATYSSRDYLFEVPDSSLDASENLTTEIQAGRETYPLVPNGLANAEQFLYPARVADRFDSIGPEGNDRNEQLNEVYEAVPRDAKLRAQAAAAHSVSIQATGHTAVLVPGQKFTLMGLSDSDGDYLALAIEHTARNPAARSGQDHEYTYINRTVAIPTGVPYRPRRQTPRPIIPGPQTAVVVGPSGQPSFLDKFGRVKVQFRWDRGNAGSCWLRVAQVWAGNNWGAFFWPRIGHEVVVIFEDGDPDRPLVIGSVYNAHNTPPVDLPGEAKLAGFKSCTMGGDPTKQSNVFYFDDTPGGEYVHMHSESAQVQHSQGTSFAYLPNNSYSIQGNLPG